MIDYKYHDLLEEILEQGYIYEDPNRKGVKRIQINSHTLKHDFAWGFPLLTTKKVHYPSAIGEFLTFINGDNSLKGLKKRGVNFWDKDAYRKYKEDYDEEMYKCKLLDPRQFTEKALKDGYSLGKIYPYQMRSWNGEVDQLHDLIHTLRNNPMATKKTVTMWNPSDKDDMCLTPCHYMFEALVEPLDKGGYGLTIKWSQHSCDVFLGIPFNIVYYSLMCYTLAAASGMEPLGIEGSLTNVHIYENHLEAVKEQLKRDVDKYTSPRMYMSEFSKDLLHRMKDLNSLDLLSKDDFKIEHYESYPAIKAEMLTYSK